MVEHVDLPSPVAVVQTGVPGRASPSRRAAALGLDLALLTVCLLAVLLLGVAVADAEVVFWVALVWAVLVAPLYFALYHAFGGPDGGPGATPGQHELGLCVRDEGTGGRLGLRRSLLRSYGGLIAAVLVLPAIADLLEFAARGGGRAPHDRLFGSTVVRVPVGKRGLAPAKPTTPELWDLFAAEGYLWPRAQHLARLRLSELLTAAIVLYACLVGFATVLMPLMVGDLGLGGWTALSLLMFLSGVFWTQAVLVLAVEAIRTGEHLSAAGLVGRASQRANALTVALLLLVILLVAAPFTLFLSLLLFARFALAVPTIVLEDTTVFGAFARSWRLTRGQTGRALGLLLASGAALFTTVGVALGFAFAIVGSQTSDAGVWAFCLAAALALMLASVPVSFVLASVGTTWCLFYYELRRREDVRAPAVTNGDGGVPRAAAG